jgi:hypothetical protein
MKQRKANWIGHIFLSEKLLKHYTERNIEGWRRRGRRLKQLKEEKILESK